MLYYLYICFENGHNIAIERGMTIATLAKAEELAKYHAQQTVGVACWFEVWHNGDICMSTR